MTKVARDVMTTNPACCTPSMTLDQVAKLMVHNDCGEIPVVDGTDQPIGVITDRDIVCRVVAEGTSLEIRHVPVERLLAATEVVARKNGDAATSRTVAIVVEPPAPDAHRRDAVAADLGTREIGLVSPDLDGAAPVIRIGEENGGALA